ncbi:MAG: ABC transporter ATP-binding protein [Eubacteriales bacterium]|nr:ABC transporter ATP-binding protein [Eubacteriales bacterium]
MIRLEHVSKSYKKVLALSDFSYHFEAHKSYGILGVNGAGKSTLIACITRNLAYRGKIDFEDLSPWEIGYVPQELAIYPELSVLDNLLFFASAYRIDKRQARETAEGLIECVGLADKRDALAKSLSGGMKRKLNLITALVHKPKILICDEVCVGIDPVSRDEILKYLRELRDAGMTMLYCSHYLDEVEHLCNQIIFLNEGRLILEGETQRLVAEMGESEHANLSDLFMKVMRKEVSL